MTKSYAAYHMLSCFRNNPQKDQQKQTVKRPTKNVPFVNANSFSLNYHWLTQVCAWINT